MANPFALVIPVGCCYLFLFLSIYTASYSPYLHLVQTALSTVRWFNVGDDFHFAFAFTMLTVALTTATAATSARRLWDPGIDPTAWLGIARSSIDPVMGLIVLRCRSMLLLEA